MWPLWGTCGHQRKGIDYLYDFRTWAFKSLTTFSKNIIASAKETKASKCACDWTLIRTQLRIIVVFSRDHLRSCVYICQTTKLSFALVHKLVVGNLQIKLSFISWCQVLRFRQLQRKQVLGAVKNLTFPKMSPESSGPEQSWQGRTLAPTTWKHSAAKKCYQQLKMHYKKSGNICGDSKWLG